MSDERLAIEVESLRQDLSSGVEKIRWIDTSVMLADPLTKSMKADMLFGVFWTAAVWT